jgi:hypothetical protein
LFKKRKLRRVFGPTREKWGYTGKDSIMSFITCTLHKIIFWGDQVKEDTICGICIMHGGDEKRS